MFPVLVLFSGGTIVLTSSVRDLREIQPGFVKWLDYDEVIHTWSGDYYLGNPDQAVKLLTQDDRRKARETAKG